MARKLFLVVCLALAISGCSSSDNANDGVKKLTVAVAAPGLPFLQLYVADEKGLFKKHGLDVEFVSVEGSAAATAAVQSGSADVTVSLPEGVITAQAAGAPLKIIGATVNKNLYKMFVADGIKSLSDLAGKKIAMLTEGNGTDIQARLLLDKEGAGQAKSSFVATGALPNRLAAVKNGQVSGALLFPPFDLVAEKQGLKSLFSLDQLTEGYPNEVVATSQKAIKAKAESLQAFMDAIVEAAAYITGNFDEAVAVGVKVTGSPEPEVRQSLQDMLSALSKDGSVSPSGLSEVIDAMDAYSNFDKLPTVKESYDDQFVDAS